MKSPRERAEGAVAEYRQHTPGRWTCFHCGETFTDRDAALQHFGANEMSYPACQIDIAKYREMEALHARNLAEDTERDRTIYRLLAEHPVALRREEESGYAKGLADGRKDARTAIGHAVADARAQERARAARLVLGADLSEEYCGEELRRVAEEIEHGEA